MTKILTLSGNKKGTQLSWGVKTKPVELSKKLKQIWVALSILIWAVTLQKIDRTKVSGPKMRSKVKILIWNWWKLAKSTILLPGPNKCTHFQMGATTKLEEISKMLRCLFVALYMQFLVDPTTYPKFPIVSLLSQWQQRKSRIQHFHSKFLLPKMTSAAIEIAGKLLRIWGRLWGPPKTTYTGLLKDTLTSLLSLMVWLHDPCKEKCL